MKLKAKLLQYGDRPAGANTRDCNHNDFRCRLIRFYTVI